MILQFFFNTFYAIITVLIVLTDFSLHEIISPSLIYLIALSGRKEQTKNPDLYVRGSAGHRSKGDKVSFGSKSKNHIKPNHHKETLRYIRVPCGDFLLKQNRDLLEQVTVQARQTQLDAASERSINLYETV